jgi:argininosuccinate lyase
MEKEKLLKIVKNVNDTPNKDLLEAANDLYTEFEKTKQLIIDLTRHLDSVEVSYNKVNNELKNRQKK